MSEHGAEAPPAHLDRPIFVIGVDHSGTSILFRMLARHEDLGWFTQYSLRGGELSWRRRVPFGPAINRISRRLFGVPWQKRPPLAERLPVVVKLQPLPHETPGIWRRVVPRTGNFLTESELTPKMRSEIHRILSGTLAPWRRKRIIVKVPYLTRAVRLLDAAVPGARFIHIVRDGRAVALSNRDLHREGTTSPQEALRVAAQEWVDTLAYVADASAALGDRYHELRYEALCADVHGALRDCLDFCGLDQARVDLDDVPRTLEVTNGRWLDGCSPAERALIDDVQADTLRTWGYQTFADAGDSPTPPPSVKIQT